MVRAGISSIEASTVDIGRDRRVDAILEPLTAAHGTANLRGRNALAHARQQMQRRAVTDSLGQRGQRESGAVRHDEFHLVREDVRAAAMSRNASAPIRKNSRSRGPRARRSRRTVSIEYVAPATRSGSSSREGTNERSPAVARTTMA